MLAKGGSSREGGDKGQEGDKGERGDELHGDFFVAYWRILFLRRDGWENCTVLVLEREEVDKGEEVEDVHCEEVEDVNGDEVEDVHGEEVDQAENAEQCGSKSGLSFAVKTVETVTVHSDVYFLFFL